jgi:hypothetical protein
MAGLETWTMTYEQAIHEADQRMLRDRLYKAQQDLIRGHFEVDR